MGYRYSGSATGSCVRPTLVICSSLKPGGHRKPLLSNWAIRESVPGAGAAALAAASWLPVKQLMPVAAALRDIGAWSLDGPARDFDSQDWWYRLEFDGLEAAAGQRVVLGFDGLATLAQAWLNGKPLLASDNMFVAHECDVSDALRPAGNELLIHFSAQGGWLAQRRPRPRWRVPMLAQQQLRWSRTTLLGRTPGWSPPAAVVGPWKDVWLERRGALHIGDAHVDCSVRGSAGVVKCRVELPNAAADGVEVMLQLERDGRKHEQRLARSGGVFSAELEVPDVQLWWPHTHGEPALYMARLMVRGRSREEVEVATGQLGFRTIELDTAAGDFRIKVNGVPVFARGACWTPLDPVSLRSTPPDCRAALTQARSAGMNMLRVAGTMVYEEDHFYEACDQLGLLVWQDFMFASMDYPAGDEAFTASVAAEATQQLRRLQAHPCLAVLCGNSEVEQQAAMWGAPREQWQSPLFDHTLAELCAAHAPRTPYWPSSAHGGSFPHQADAGTTSYYGVGAYLRPLDDARRANLKFATECLAFANVPADSAIARMPGGLATRVHHPNWKARSPRDLGAGWDFDDVRDHYLRLLFGVDPRQLRSTDHDRYLALSRLASAEAMAAAFSEWRRPASRCGGALVLFLRDLWAGAGWGVVDDSGTPKACWHYLKRALQPLTVLLTDEGGNGLFVHAINEREQDEQVEIELTAWRAGDVQVAAQAQTLTLPGRSARTLSALDLFGHFMDLTYAYRFGPPPCDVVVVTLKHADGERIAQAFHFPAGVPCAQEADVGLSAQARKVSGQAIELTVSTRRFALGVHFDIPGWAADDEHFHLAPGGQARVMLRGDGSQPPHGMVHAVNTTHAAQIAVCS
jgi:beta-mannosidase